MPRNYRDPGALQVTRMPGVHNYIETIIHSCDNQEASCVELAMRGDVARVELHPFQIDESEVLAC